MALLVVLVPLVALQVVTFTRWQRARVGELLQSRNDAAQVLSFAFERFVADIVHQNQGLEAAIRLENAFQSRDRLRRLLAETSAPYRTVSNYAVTDASGRVVASAPLKGQGVSVADRDYFREIKAGRSWAVSDLVIERITNQTTFVVASPLTGPDGKFRGAVLAAVNTSLLNEIFPSRLIEHEVVLLDGTGRLVFDNRFPNVPLPKRDWSRNPMIREVISGRSGVGGIYESPLTGERVIGSFVPISGIGWAAGSFVPADEATAPISQSSRAVIAGTVVAVLSSVVLIWLLGTYVTGPIQSLTRQTRDFAGGVSVPPVEMATGDEVRELAESFDSMKDRIVKREAQLVDLVRSNEQLADEAGARAGELDAIIDNIPAGVIIAQGEEGRIVRMNAAAERLHGMAMVPNVAIPDYSETYHLFRVDGTAYPPEELPLSRAIRKGHVVSNEEVVIERPSGERLTALVLASPIRAESGDVAGAVAIVQDISERKLVEDRERVIAEVLQDSLYSPPLGGVGGVAIGSKYVAALEEARVGGDFLDIFQVEDGNVAVVIGDVSGKGLSAAVDVAMAKYYIRSYCFEYPDSPEQVMARVNTAMISDLDFERFVTAFLGIIDLRNGTLVYASAGHEPQLIRHGEDGSIEELWPTGMALGVFPDRYGRRQVEMSKRDVLVLYTDGATEARPPGGEMLGVCGLRRLVSDLEVTDPQSMAEAVYQSLRAYSQGEIRDDFALLIAEHQREGSSEHRKGPGVGCRRGK